MRTGSLIRITGSAATALVCALAAIGCGGGGDDDPLPTAPATATAKPTDVPGVGRVGAGRSLRSADGRLEVAGQGRELDVTIVAMEKPQAAPKGWVFTSPVFDITARDAGRTVSTLETPLKLTFKADGTGTVMTLAAGTWEIVPSERGSSGSIEASITHLSPYVVGRPATAPQVRSNATPTATATSATISPTATQTAVPTPSASPGGGGTASITATPTPSAEDQVDAAIEAYKSGQVHVTTSSAYASLGSVVLPAGLVSSLNAANSVAGGAVGGTYGVINEAFSARATTGAATGSFTFLAEPQTGYPSSSSSAQQQLVALFPGAAGYTYTPVSAAAGYIYWASAGSNVIVLGFIQYQDISIAYLASGSGSYIGAALAARTP